MGRIWPSLASLGSSAGVLTYLHADRIGSIIATTNSSGAVTNKNLYSAFGEGVPAGSTFGFTGQRYDSETGLYYYKRRYYNPAIGRFLQPDTIGYTTDLNLYTYVNNDPLNKLDPTGQVTLLLAIAALIFAISFFILVIVNSVKLANLYYSDLLDLLAQLQKFLADRQGGPRFTGTNPEGNSQPQYQYQWVQNPDGSWQIIIHQNPNYTGPNNGPNNTQNNNQNINQNQDPSLQFNGNTCSP